MYYLALKIKKIIKKLINPQVISADKGLSLIPEQTADNHIQKDKNIIYITTENSQDFLSL